MGPLVRVEQLVIGQIPHNAVNLHCQMHPIHKHRHAHNHSHQGIHMQPNTTGSYTINSQCYVHNMEQQVGEMVGFVDGLVEEQLAGELDFPAAVVV